jgi:hypothetical protein
VTSTAKPTAVLLVFGALVEGKKKTRLCTHGFFFASQTDQNTFQSTSNRVRQSGWGTLTPRLLSFTDVSTEILQCPDSINLEESPGAGTLERQYSTGWLKVGCSISSSGPQIS